MQDQEQRSTPSPRGTLILLRHGESTSNAADTFSGWLDVALTPRGEAEAAQAAAMLTSAGLLPDVVHSSVLTRAIHSADIVVGVMGRAWVPRATSWRLNERHYGALQGRSKAAVRAEVGDTLFHQWRRSFSERPPPLPDADPSAARHDPRYRFLPQDAVPASESLRDVQARLLPYWSDTLARDLLTGCLPLVVAHGNSIRALVMHLDRLSDKEVETLNIPTGIPLVYDLDSKLHPIRSGGRYLDPVGAQAGAAKIAAQGQSG